jgi:hypothetical protein
MKSIDFTPSALKSPMEPRMESARISNPDNASDTCIRNLPVSTKCFQKVRGKDEM